MNGELVYDSVGDPTHSPVVRRQSSRITKMARSRQKEKAKGKRKKSKSPTPRKQVSQHDESDIDGVEENIPVNDAKEEVPVEEKISVNDAKEEEVPVSKVFKEKVLVHIVNEEVSGIDEEVIIVNTKEKTVKVDVNNMIEETAASVIKEVSVEEMSDVDNVEEKIIVDHAKEDVLVNEVFEEKVLVNVTNDEVSGIDGEVKIITDDEKVFKVDNNMIREATANVIKEVHVVEETSIIDGTGKKYQSTLLKKKYLLIKFLRRLML